MSNLRSALQRAVESTRQTARFYRPELDALRFFALLSVFFCHAPSIGHMLHGSKWQRPVTENLPIAI